MSSKTFVLVALLACSCAKGAPEPVAPPPQRVAELAGRLPVTSQRCIGVESGRLFRISNSDPHVLLYEEDKVIWVSTLEDSCGFAPGQTVIPDSNAAYYCKGDLVRSGEQVTLLPFGRICALGNFTAFKFGR
jgi:hypothetical protein